MTEHPVVLGGRYELIEVIGRGGMAEVWRANDRRLGRDVAVKRLRIDLATDETFQARFRREAQSAAGLNHPNIVSVYDTGEEVDVPSGVAVPFIVMELVEGHTLREVLRDGRKILPEKSLEFTAGVLDGLSYSHRAGIIHRDIKPANVMLTRTGMVKVMDFGIARAVADTSATMTQTAAVIGTAQYLSPEQARGETVDNRSDIYSTGCLLYELLTGRPPFQGDSPVSVAYQHVRENPTPPSQLDPEVTPEMDAIVLKSLAKNPADRYQTAREMRDDIVRLMAGEPITASIPAPLPEPAPSQTALIADGVPTAAAAFGVAPAQTAGSPARALIEETDEAPPGRPPRRLSAGMWVLIALLVALLGTVGYGMWQFLQPAQPQLVAVPNLSGSTQTQAAASLQNVGLVLGTVQRTNGKADNTVGTVINQDPAPQTRRERGTKVDIVINDGPKQGTVPDVTGQTEAQARQVLAVSGFTDVVTELADPKTEPVTAVKGTVTQTNPRSGESVPPETRITLTIATGMRPVPSLVGQTEKQATESLKAAGLTLGKVTRTNGTADATVNTIIKQQTEPGTLMEMGAEVAVTINDGPKQGTLPDVSGQPEATARKTLADAGFTNVTSEPANPASEPITAKKGAVVGMNPAPGTQMPSDNAIVLTVATGTSPIPNLIGKTLAEATAIAGQSGFTVAATNKQTASYPAGQVFEQTPTSPGNAERGIAIAISIAQPASGSTPPSPPATP